MASWFSLFAGKPAKPPELKEAESTYTDSELKELQKLWRDELARQTARAPQPRGGVTGRGLTGEAFGKLLGPAWRALDPLLASQLLRLVANKEDGTVHLDGFVVAKARLERLGEEASLTFTYRLLDVYGDGVRHEALRAAVASCLRLAGVAAPPSPTPQRGRGDGGGADAVDRGGEASETTRGATKQTAMAHASASSPSASALSSSPAAAAVEVQIEAICRGALLFATEATAGDGGGSNGSATRAGDYKAARLTFDGFRQWLKRCPALHATLSRSLLHVEALAAGVAAATGGDGASGAAGVAAAALPPPIHGRPLVQLPALAQLGKLPASATLLQPAWVWALSCRLPRAQRSEWRLLFSSQRDGKSFNTFFGRVSAAPGPTLMLLRDRGGALFGGYASQPWAKSGSFYGDVSCFIFSLEPTLQVFPATGINDNYQWCGVGFSQLPAGLGWGGAAGGRSTGNLSGAAGGVGAGGHFALYIEPSLDAGMSRPIATYGNSPLASEQLFQIETLECWLLQPPEEEEELAAARGASAAAGGGGGGVLSKGAQDAALMELAGFTLHSKALREEPLEED